MLLKLFGGVRNLIRALSFQRLSVFYQTRFNLIVTKVIFLMVEDLNFTKYRQHPGKLNCPLHLIECQIGDSKISAEGRERGKGKFCMRRRFPLLSSPLDKQGGRDGRCINKSRRSYCLAVKFVPFSVSMFLAKVSGH